MAHLTVKSGYTELVDRLNRFPQGAPPSKLLYQILQMLFSQKEAELVAMVPIQPFTAQKASDIWKMDLVSTQKVLDQLAGRAILLDVEQQNGESIYALPPPMAGFFEFALMRVRNDIDQQALSELFYQYLNVEDNFIRELYLGGETQLGRVFVNEPALATGNGGNGLQILDYERASEAIKNASHIGIGTCYCRHKMSHKGLACHAPMEICMTLNTCAASLIKHDFARQVDAVEAMDVLQTAYEHNLVQFGENVREGVSFICNCCGCCCEALQAIRRFGMVYPIHTNFIPEIENEKCNGCTKCVNICPVEAMTLVSANDPHHPKKKKAKLDEDMCLGCGVCVRVCRQDAIKLRARPERIITPLNSAHRFVMMAIERGTLQDMIFDNRALWRHRAMAAILGVILRLPPIKQAMASKQMKSRYLEAIIKRMNV